MYGDLNIIDHYHGYSKKWSLLQTGPDFEDSAQETEDLLVIDDLDFRPVDNSKKHQTHYYELLQGKEETPVYRRGRTFCVNLVSYTDFEWGNNLVSFLQIRK